MYHMYLLVLTILNKCVSDKFECFFKNQRKLKMYVGTYCKPSYGALGYGRVIWAKTVSFWVLTAF